MKLHIEVEPTNVALRHEVWELENATRMYLHVIRWQGEIKASFRMTEEQAFEMVKFLKAAVEAGLARLVPPEG